MNSFYKVLCELAKQHSLFLTGGCCDQLRFNLTEKKIFTGNTVLMNEGKALVPQIQLKNGNVYQVEGIPLITEEELGSDTDEKLNTLYALYKSSVPSERSGYTKGIFRAKEIDELSDAELARNQDRILLRYQLEAYILLASLEGKILWPAEKHWFRKMDDPDFVILRDWIK